MTTFTNDKPTFRERVFALAGHSTYREPTGGGTTHLRAIPADHMIAAALSFGRRSVRNSSGVFVPDANDVGPDIAIDMATGIAGHYGRVCAALGRALSADRSALVRRNRQHIGHVAMAAYSVVLGRACPPCPDGVTDEDWGDLVAAGALVLERLAEDALSLAARRARRVA
ncbi:hypothetical protein [Luteibacter yeojuensis]|uniref:Uncharacterized protein n=1 Tax=Luteibacter yeojuensis TaxID=345309 RepID=A0A7X5TP56_9GAMM|nr:hypothetical protein [Luteibacter yeojuensis]NID14359.1 hypothetical protein [Luteibacter yeojuensis]